MNLLDLIDDNIFLTELFPAGFPESIGIGSYKFSFDGGVELCFYLIEKPAIEVAKWGEWGVDYNLIMLTLMSTKKEQEFIYKSDQPSKASKFMNHIENNQIIFEQYHDTGYYKISFPYDNLRFKLIDCVDYFIYETDDGKVEFYLKGTHSHYNF